MELPNKLKNEISDYCKINNIMGVDDFIIKLITQGFTIEKYGSAPIIGEKIIEVPIEKIIEKEVYITNNTEIKQLTDKLKILESQLIDIKGEHNKEISILQKKNNLISIELDETKNNLEKLKNKKDLYGE